MSLYLPHYNAAFYHIPKCGGFWVEEALLRAGLTVRLIPLPGDLQQADRHAWARHFPDVDFSFAFVRKPCDWYESFWKYTAGKHHSWDDWAWHPIYPLLWYRRNDFSAFIGGVIAHLPGFLSQLFDTYARDCTMVGRVETLADDLWRILCAMGHAVPRDVLVGMAVQNRTVSVVGEPVWGPGQKERVNELEGEIFERWYR